jgi:PEP-CTERM motif
MSIKGKPRGLLLAAALCASVPAGATTLTIINPSFELPAVTMGGLQTGATGWDILGPNTDSGVWNIEDAPLGFWNTPVPGLDGNQVAYLASGFSPAGGGLAQTLSCSACSLDPGFLYTLTGVVGVPKLESSTTPSPNYLISLWAGSNLLGSISGSGPERTLAPFTLLVKGSDFSRFTGQQLRIELFSDGPQTAVDALALQATAAVPEPGSVALFAVGIGLLGFSLRVRDKRRMTAA